MYESLSWRLEPRILPPTPHKHLYLWSNYCTNGIRWYFPTYLIYILLLYIFILLPTIFFCVFSSSSSFSFFFFFPLSQGHMKQKNGGQLPISACFDGCFGWNQLYQPILAAISTEISRISSRFCWNPAELAQIRKNKGVNQRVGRQTLLRDEFDAVAAILEPLPCFLGQNRKLMA